MTPLFKGINLRQYGLQRIDITAIVMLLIALAIVLIANLPNRHQPDVVQAGSPAQALPAAHAGTVTATQVSTRGSIPGAPFLSSGAGQETETP